MRRAARTDANHGEIRSLLRALCPVVEDTSRFGSGWPDLMLRTVRGSLWFVEIKDGAKIPSKRQLTPAEIDFRDRWPMQYRIVETVDQAIELARE